MDGSFRSAQRLQVLVVEPRDVVAARLTDQLERVGHHVLGRARDGREAVASAHRFHPDLILLNSALPGLDAIDTARAIVSDQPVPVVLVAGYVGAELVRRAREAGVLAYATSTDLRGLLAAVEVARERFAELRILRREADDPSETPAAWKLVDHAKKLLMARLGLSEPEAFLQLLLRRRNTRRSLRETAWTIVEAEEVVRRLDVARCLPVIFHALRR
ncbi:MAG: response regulator [Candidatus Rokubacteria bacterium]|nr:response regulator [Candidatus Rokubacteria bacterium]